MAKDWVPHVVGPGEHLHGIAFKVGSDPDTLWKAPQNAALAAKRPNREMLCVGDVLYVPAEPPDPLPLTVGSTNSYSAVVPKTHVALRFAADPIDRVANKPFEVHGAGGAKPITGTVGADGSVEFDVPVNVRSVEVVVPDANIHSVMLVGELDPIDERSGVIQRLRNLGFLHAPDEVPEEYVTHAIREFQQSKGLKADGELTPETRDAVRDAHGS